MRAANAAQKLLFQESCYFTWKLNLLSCSPDAPCEPVRITAADFQRQTSRYYRGQGPPPLDIAYTAACVDDDFRRSMMQECFPMFFIASLLVATSQLYISAPDVAFGHLENALMVRRFVPDRLFELFARSWPLEAAMIEFEATAARVPELLGPDGGGGECARSVHVVVCHCAEDLSWIEQLPSASCLNLFVYEKCLDDALSPEDFSKRFAGFRTAFQVYLPDDGPKRNECIAYLQHIVSAWGELADYTVFLQGDGPSQVTDGLLDVVVAALPRGVYDAPFLSLGADRVVEHTSTCRDVVYAEIFEEQAPPMSSYCCAILVVRKDSIERRALPTYTRMIDALNAPEHAACPRVPGEALRCLMFEQFWHILFGAMPELPLREEDMGLPLIVRLPDHSSKLSRNASAFAQRAFSVALAE